MTINQFSTNSNQKRDFKRSVQGVHDDDDDDDDDAPWGLDDAAGGSTAADKAKGYGSSLLPGEGSAIAQFVQQNLRIPRRGEIGYSGDEIASYETLGYVTLGSRHTRMNAVRIRRENQIYSVEEQRALALITLEENQQREAALLEDFRSVLRDKQNAYQEGRKTTIKITKWFPKRRYFHLIKRTGIKWFLLHLVHPLQRIRFSMGLQDSSFLVESCIGIIDIYGAGYGV